MADTYDDYAAARDAVLEATDEADLVAADVALRQAEAPFIDQIAVAWDENCVRVGEAKQSLAEALRAQAATETACGNSARQRWGLSGCQGFPVLDDKETERVVAARDDTEAARLAHEEAKTQFKAGVTVEQLVGA
jgi:hypothetical protein